MQFTQNFSRGKYKLGFGCGQQTLNFESDKHTSQYIKNKFVQRYPMTAWSIADSLQRSGSGLVPM